MRRNTPLTKLLQWLAIPLLALLVLGACTPADSGDEAATEAETESSAEYEPEETAAAVTEEIADEVAATALALEVKTQLLQELGADFLDVEVETIGSTAILRGEVQSEPPKETAKEIALAVDGVEEVDNRIVVAEDADSSTPVADNMAEAETEVRDAVLESRVKTQLLREIGRYGFDIEVEANAGTVTLRGTAPDAEREEIALETARGVSGAEDVIDLIEVEES